MISILLFALLVLGTEIALDTINLRHLRRHGGEIPTPFRGVVDREALQRAADYTFARNRVGMIESLAVTAAFLFFLFGGWLAPYERWVAGVSGSFVGGGVVFFLGLILARTVLGLPFSLYRTFRVERDFGFNTTTPKLWMSDLIKSLILSVILSAILIGGALWLVETAPRFWWLWVWGFFALFTVLLMYLSPVLIEPLFFKFEPLRREGLEEAIRDLMSRAGLAVSRVFQVDASRRSRHSNAYFTGIGRVKRIVLFDTLLEQMKDQEILAVLAHEVGHWRLRHVLRRIIFLQIAMLVGLYLAFRLVGWEGLPAIVGLADASFAGRALILLFLAGLVSFFFTPLSSYSSRRHEWQADDFASRLTGRPADLASALVKLSLENLANLHPHPLYAWFHYSHPPMVQRIERLLGRAEPEGERES
jgi:STE24 endopeptidase